MSKEKKENTSEGLDHFLELPTQQMGSCPHGTAQDNRGDLRSTAPKR